MINVAWRAGQVGAETLAALDMYNNDDDVDDDVIVFLFLLRSRADGDDLT